MVANNLYRTSDFCEKYKTKEIQNELKRRGVTRLCHMTQIDNLIQILIDDTGILADDYIEEEKLHRNDPDRLDGRTDYISTSIQFPNVWYYRYRRNVRSGMTDWAIIFIDTDICRKSNTLFSSVNAATANGACLGTGVRRLKDSFECYVGGRPRTSNMLSNCPTDDQAEVMIYKEIPTSYFQGIAFENMETMEKFIDMADDCSINYPRLYLAPELFTTSLSKKIRSGIEPSELFIEEESELWRKDLCL